MAAADEIVTKAEFAKLVQRDPAFVSRAIASGRIHGPALVGEGRAARIRVAEAFAQLGRSLDLSQQLAQDKPILTPVGGGMLLDDGDSAERAGVHGLREESLELKNKKTRLELERMEREQLRQAGELVLAADVAAALRRQLQPLVSTFDELPAAIAKPLSEQFGVPYAEVLIAVKGCIRQQRSSWAARARALAEAQGIEA